MRLAALIVAAILATTAGRATGPARGQHPAGLSNVDARAHYDAGMKAAATKDYATAERELETAYAIEPNRQLLYALGQIARLSGDCTKAVERFEAYLDTNPPADAVADTEELIRRCEPLVDKPDPEPDPVPPPVVEPDPNPDPVREPPPDRELPPSGPDVLGVTLTAVGGTLTVVGLGVFGGAFAVQQGAESKPDVGAFEDSVHRARTMYFTGIGIASVGAALAIGGIVRLVVVARQRKRAASARR